MSHHYPFVILSNSLRVYTNLALFLTKNIFLFVTLIEYLENLKMSINLNELPAALQAYKQQIAATKKDSIEISLLPAEHLEIWQSKVGGHPYLPLAQQYPQSSEGENLQLLAQINFAELPENNIYPQSGILQFFINPHDDLYGMDFDDQQKQDGFKVIFHDSVEHDSANLQTDFPSFDGDDIYSPISGQAAIQFEKSESYIDMNNFDFAEKVTDPYDRDDEEEFCDEYTEVISASGHRLGGYPFFTQTDPREYNESIQDYVLLLQIDTDDAGEVDIMWGDSGVGNFFIHPDDLAKRDFSKVVYNWDCY